MRTERHSKDDVVIVINRSGDRLILLNGEPRSTYGKDKHVLTDPRHTLSPESLVTLRSSVVSKGWMGIF